MVIIHFQETITQNLFCLFCKTISFNFFSTVSCQIYNPNVIWRNTSFNLSIHITFNLFVLVNSPVDFILDNNSIFSIFLNESIDIIPVKIHFWLFNVEGVNIKCRKLLKKRRKNNVFAILLVFEQMREYSCMSVFVGMKFINHVDMKWQGRFLFFIIIAKCFCQFNVLCYLLTVLHQNRFNYITQFYDSMTQFFDIAPSVNPSAQHICIFTKASLFGFCYVIIRKISFKISA